MKKIIIFLLLFAIGYSDHFVINVKRYSDHVCISQGGGETIVIKVRQYLTYWYGYTEAVLYIANNANFYGSYLIIDDYRYDVLEVK